MQVHFSAVVTRIFDKGRYINIPGAIASHPPLEPEQQQYVFLEIIRDMDTYRETSSRIVTYMGMIDIRQRTYRRQNGEGDYTWVVDLQSCKRESIPYDHKPGDIPEGADF